MFSIESLKEHAKAAEAEVGAECHAFVAWIERVVLGRTPEPTVAQVQAATPETAPAAPEPVAAEPAAPETVAGGAENAPQQ